MDTGRVCLQDKAQFTPEGYVQENARVKAQGVWAQLSAEGAEGSSEAAVPPDLVIGGDTVRQPETGRRADPASSGPAFQACRKPDVTPIFPDFSRFFPFSPGLLAVFPGFLAPRR